MKIIPTETIERREFTITGKRHHGCRAGKAMITTVQHDEFGEIVPHFDGEINHYAVQLYDSVGMPVGRRYFGGNKERAMKFYMSNCI